jgi:hypothetical protein
VCLAEQEHISNARKYHPNACNEVAKGSKPKWGPDEFKVGSDAWCYGRWTEVQANQKVLDCLAADAGLPCVERQLSVVRDFLARQRQLLDEGCGSDWHP